MKNIALFAMTAFIAIYTIYGDAKAIDLGFTQVDTGTAQMGGSLLAVIIGILVKFFPSLKHFFKLIRPESEPLDLVNDLEIKIGGCPECRTALQGIRKTLLKKKFDQSE